MTGEQIVLNDETIIPGARAGRSDGYLWVYFAGFSMLETAEIFCDAEKTCRIEYDYGEMSAVYEGYTNCRTINIDYDGNVSVCLARGETDNV